MDWKQFFLLLFWTLMFVSFVEPLQQQHSAHDVLTGDKRVHVFPLGRILAEAPGTSVVEDTLFILAANRTDRPDITNHFRKYRGGWNIRSSHYLASVAFTGLPAIVCAILWLAWGLLLTLLLCCCCCCCRDRVRSDNEPGVCRYFLPMLLLIFLTGVAIVGCVGLYYGEEKFHTQLEDTLDYIVNQSAVTVQGLRNTSAYLTSAASINVSGIGLSDSDKQSISSLNTQLNSSATTLQDKTNDNAHKIRHVINIARIVLIVVAAVMVALALLGLLFAACGLRTILSSLVFVGWLLVTATWILCFVFIVLDNTIGDTCAAMDDWVRNPSANTTLDEILPCVDPGTASNALTQSKKLTSSIINAVNKGLVIVNTNFPPGVPASSGNYNQSGPLVPSLCSIYGPAPTYSPLQCVPGTVTFASAPGNWSAYVCETNSAGKCTSVGRLTTTIYSELVTAIRVADGLHEDINFLVGVADCTFVREAFQTIENDHCHDLRKYSKWIWVGLILVSGGSSFAILMWIVHIRRRKSSRQRSRQRINDTKPVYGGRPVAVA